MTGSKLWRLLKVQYRFLSQCLFAGSYKLQDCFEAFTAPGSFAILHIFLAWWCLVDIYAAIYEYKCIDISIYEYLGMLTCEDM